MKKVYAAYTEECGEVEGMFDEDGNLLDLWSSNDATWRNEYFSGFMKKLGIEVKTAPETMNEKLAEEAEKLWG